MSKKPKRTTVLISPEQAELLRAESAATGIKIQSLVARAIEAYFENIKGGKK